MPRSGYPEVTKLTLLHFLNDFDEYIDSTIQRNKGFLFSKKKVSIVIE